MSQTHGCLSETCDEAFHGCRGAHQGQIGPLELKPVVPGGIGFLQAEVQASAKSGNVLTVSLMSVAVHGKSVLFSYGTHLYCCLVKQSRLLRPCTALQHCWLSLPDQAMY